MTSDQRRRGNDLDGGGRSQKLLRKRVGPVVAWNCTKGNNVSWLLTSVHRARQLKPQSPGWQKHPISLVAVNSEALNCHTHAQTHSSPKPARLSTTLNPSVKASFRAWSAVSLLQSAVEQANIAWTKLPSDPSGGSDWDTNTMRANSYY